jgi:hypothetical protein
MGAVGGGQTWGRAAGNRRMMASIEVGGPFRNRSSILFAAIHSLFCVRSVLFEDFLLVGSFFGELDMEKAWGRAPCLSY